MHLARISKAAGIRGSGSLWSGLGALTCYHTFYVWLVFLAHVTCSAPGMLLLENEFPWRGLVSMLNNLSAKYKYDRLKDNEFPVPGEGIQRPLPEDYSLRGLDWAKWYFPDGWFRRAQVDDEDRSVELPAMENIRIERIMWLATHVAGVRHPLGTETEWSTELFFRAGSS